MTEKKNSGILKDGYGMMPNMVLFDTKLKARTKLLYCLISSLCAQKGHCWATNKYLAEKLHHTTVKRGKMSGDTISKMVTELKNTGYISIEMYLVNNAIKNRIITLNNEIVPLKGTILKVENSIDEIDDTTIDQINDTPIDETNYSLYINNKKNNSIKVNTTMEGVSTNTPNISELVCETPNENKILEIIPKEKKEKNSAKKEKVDKLSNCRIAENILLNKGEFKTHIDQCRLILFIYNNLKTKGKIRGEDTFFKKINKQFKKGIDYKDIINAIWTLSHNTFCNGESGGRGWVWGIDYLFDTRGIDKAWTYKIDKIDSENSTELRDKLKYILTLPSEFKSAENSNKGVLENTNNLSQKEKDYIDKNTVSFG